MIDFRYHVVSLVAVFLALAVGIVLGAGPLREELSTTLEEQVAELRAERSELRAELEDTIRRSEAKDDLVRVMTGPLAAGRLTDVRVAMVLLPGSDRNISETAELTIRRAGGTVVSTTELTEAWEDQENADTRHEAAVELAGTLDVPPPRSGGDPTVSTVLAAMLAGADAPGQVGQWRPAEWRLEELGLIEMTWAEQEGPQDGPAVDDRRPADAVVLVSGGLTQLDTEQPAGQLALEQRLDLVAALGALELPTVVLAGGTDAYLDPATEQPQDTLLAALRADDDIAATVSSVDNGENASGLLTLVLALGRALQGEFGHWGLGPDAQAVAPPVPPVREPSDDTTDDTPSILIPPDDVVPTDGLPTPTSGQGPLGDGAEATSTPAP